MGLNCVSVCKYFIGQQSLRSLAVCRNVRLSRWNILIVWTSCRTLAEIAAATSVHVVAVIEPIIQHADWFFPGGNHGASLMGCWSCVTVVYHVLKRRKRVDDYVIGFTFSYLPLDFIHVHLYFDIMIIIFFSISLSFTKTYSDSIYWMLTSCYDYILCSRKELGFPE